MPPSRLPSDPLWPRAADWLARPAEGGAGVADVGVIGVPAHLTSITPTNAHRTPAAVRDALLRFSTYSASHDVDVAELTAFDFGDVDKPDGPSGEARVIEAVAKAARRCRFLIALGGDNSLTHSVMSGLFDGQLSACGLVTLDAHHDLRDGVTNGSPVRRLLEAGLPGANVVQIGIGDFSNSRAYAERARDAGITVVPRSALRGADLKAVAANALDVAGEGGRPVFVDVDVDVCDRAETPGCPSAAPGGISADELRQLLFSLARDSRVTGMDVTEIDSTIDAPDGRTVRLAALLVLEAAAAVIHRDQG